VTIHTEIENVFVGSLHADRKTVRATARRLTEAGLFDKAAPTPEHAASLLLGLLGAHSPGQAEAAYRERAEMRLADARSRHVRPDGETQESFLDDSEFIEELQGSSPALFASFSDLLSLTIRDFQAGRFENDIGKPTLIAISRDRPLAILDVVGCQHYRGGVLWGRFVYTGHPDWRQKAEAGEWPPSDFFDQLARLETWAVAPGDVLRDLAEVLDRQEDP
jgi:hypothetical protein